VVEHANASAVRRFLTAWFQGDVETWRSLATDDVIIRMRGNPGAGGAPADVDIQDVFADDSRAVAIVKVVYNQPPGPVELSYACAQKIDGAGKISEMWNLSDNRDAENDLFRAGEQGTVA
jgi:ketosteroid isomerase-like protein